MKSITISRRCSANVQCQKVSDAVCSARIDKRQTSRCHRVSCGGIVKKIADGHGQIGYSRYAFERPKQAGGAAFGKQYALVVSELNRNRG
jgi:hypothetical protein